MDTMGSMKASVTDWLNETVSPTRLLDAINDSIASLWHSILLANLNCFAGGPTTISMASGSERTDIVSVLAPAAIVGVLLADGNAVFPPGAAYTARATYVTDSGSETDGSPAAGITTLIGGDRPGFTVAQPPDYSGLVGWNLYIGIPGPNPLYFRCNDAPIPFDIHTWYVTDAQEGERQAGNNPGQDTAPPLPIANTTADDVMYIRKLQVLTQDGTYKSWSPADLESDMFRWMEKTLASTSSNQDYVFDFLNNRRIEVRPKLGTALTPRFFYVKKPRRVKYDSSTLPFESIEGTAFVRYRSLALLSLTLHEYDASKAWMGLAEQERQTVLLAVNTQSSGKVHTITPHMR